MISTAAAHHPTPATPPKPDVEAIKVKQRATWSSRGRTLEIPSDHLEAVIVHD